MSYITERINRKRHESAAYRDVFDEEKLLQAQELARRKLIMDVLGKQRRVKEMTQKELAERLRITQSRVSQLERGHETLSLDKFLDYAKAVGFSLVLLPQEELIALEMSNTLEPLGPVDSMIAVAKHKYGVVSR